MADFRTTKTPTPISWEGHHEENMKRRRGALDSPWKSRADTMAQECRRRLVASIHQIAASSSGGEDGLGLLLSGGVDSSAILQAAVAAGVRFRAAVTVVIVDPNDPNPNPRPPEDELYATEAARLYNKALSHNMDHRIVRLSPEQLIQEYSKPTIKTLALWGYMETRNSLIIGAAFHEAKKIGLRDVIVGDNADELFGGSYDIYFDEKYANDLAGWKAKRDSMADLPFVTNKLAKAYNVKVHQPFTNQELFVKWALGETTRNDCIGKCYIQSEFGGSYEIQNCGKLPLREAFSTVASWRRMDWIFRGSGAEEGNLLVNHWKTSVGISDEEFEAEQAEYLREGVKLKTKEHLHNIRIFREVFGGLKHPTKQRYPIGDPRGCVSCCFEIGDEQFCHLCDEYPAQHSKI